MLCRIAGRTPQAETETGQAARAALRLSLKSTHRLQPAVVVIFVIYHLQAEPGRIAKHLRAAKFILGMRCDIGIAEKQHRLYAGSDERLYDRSAAGRATTVQKNPGSAAGHFQIHIYRCPSLGQLLLCYFGKAVEEAVKTLEHIVSKSLEVCLDCR